MIKTRLQTVHFNTYLPYNCIYFIPPKQKYRDNSERYCSFLDPRDNNKVLSLQDFPFFTQVIRGEDLDELLLYKKRYLGLNYNPELGKDVLSTIRDIFPNTKNGCFVVHLLPYREQLLNENPFNTLFVGEITQITFRLEEIKEFAIEAARLNFERMTGQTWDPNNHEGFFKDRNYLNDIASFYSFGFSPTNFPQPQSQIDVNIIQQERERIKHEYKNQFAQFSIPNVDGLKTERNIIKRLIHSGYGEDLDNIDKIATIYPIKIRPKDNGDNDIFICPEDSEPILCNFGRGWMSKALYILFLRHPNGIYFVDRREDKYLKELAIIYQRLTYCDDSQANERALNIINNYSMYTNDIRKWFKERFVLAVAGKYAIEPIDDRPRNRLYGITIPRKMINLGSFNFNPFNITA